MPFTMTEDKVGVYTPSSYHPVPTIITVTTTIIIIIIYYTLTMYQELC